MSHGEEEHAALHVAVSHGVPDGAGGQADLAASDFPRRLLDPCGIQQMIVGLPSHNKTRIEASKGPQPGTSTIAAIKDMDEAASPALGGHAQELAVLIFLVTGQRTARGPPPQSRQHRWPLPMRSASQQ